MIKIYYSTFLKPTVVLPSFLLLCFYSTHCLQTYLTICACVFLADDEVFTLPAPEAPASAQAQAVTPRTPLPKGIQSGLRAPGYSSARLPVGRLAAFGFVRSSSVSSVSSAHSADSAQSDPSRTAHRKSQRVKH